MASTDHGVPPHEAPTALAAARAYIRLVGDDGIAYFRAADAEQAARAVLSRRRKPLAEQDFEQLTRSSEECEQSLPQQGELLRMYMLAALCVSVIPFVFLGMWAFADGDLSAGLGAAIIYVLPVIAVHLLAGRRATIFDRRENLLQHLLYRSPGPHPDSELCPDHVELVEHDIDMSWSEKLADRDGEWREAWHRDEERVRRDLPSNAGDAGWTNGFSGGASAADHVVDPDRHER